MPTWVYSLAYQVFTFTVQLGSLWMVATLPRHARASAAGDELREQLPLRQIVAGTSFWAGALALGAVIAGFALPHVFGSGFEQSAAPLAVLLVGTIFLLSYFAITPALLAAGRAKLLARVALVSVVVNVGLDLVLVPTIGVVGPAIATTAQTIFGAVALIFVALGREALERVLLAGGPCAFALALLAIDPRSPLLIAIAIASAALSAALGVAALRRPAVA